MKIDQSISNKFGIKMEATVEDLDGNIIKQYPIQQNLVTDYGLNNMAISWVSDLTRYIGLGDDPNPIPTNRSTGTIRLTQTGDYTITSDDDFFTIDDSNSERLLQLPEPYESCRILATDPNGREATVDKIQTFVDQPAIIWNIEQYKLTNQERVMTDLVDSTPGNHGQSAQNLDNGDGTNTIVITRWRTLYMETQDDSHTYYEAGWSPSNSTSMSCVGRIKLQPAVFVDEYNRLKIKITSYQSFVSYHTDNDDIYNVPATISYNHLNRADNYYVSSIGSNGVTKIPKNGSRNTASAFSEPKQNTAELRFTNTDGNVRTYGMTDHTYQQNSFQRYFGMNSFTVMPYDFTELTEMRFGRRDTYDGNTSTLYTSGPVITWDTPQDKNNDRRLELRIYCKWDRELPSFPSV